MTAQKSQEFAKFKALSQNTLFALIFGDHGVSIVLATSRHWHENSPSFQGDKGWERITKITKDGKQM